jgi:hypothetical protein
MTRVYNNTAKYASVIQKIKKSCMWESESQKLKASIFHLRSLFYKLGKILTTNHEFFQFFSNSHKILCFFDSNTILTSFMTSWIITVNLEEP